MKNVLFVICNVFYYVLLCSIKNKAHIYVKLLFMPITPCAKKLTHISLTSGLWDIGKQYSPRCDGAERGLPSGTILFAY